jgi:regulator of protease activity HflC (stomatin/prohibitin superfamily)
LELRAQAEAKAILLKGDAEAKRADMLQKTSLGGQISLFQLYSEMVKSSMSGVEKVIYLPTDSGNNPLGFMSMMQGGVPNLGFGLPVQESKKK